MKLQALEDAPVLVEGWEEKALSAATRQHEEVLALILWIEQHLPLEQAHQVMDLFENVQLASQELWELTLRQSVFYQWAAAAWYHRATGCHVETEAEKPPATIEQKGNVYDIRNILIQRRQ